MELFLALPFGFLIGMSHALETDHLAAISTLFDSRDGRRRLAWRGAVWGIGHSLSLLVVSIAVILLGLSVTHGVEAGLEFAVGVMIAALGIRTLWRLRKEKIHVHAHDHGQKRHVHFHSHRTDTGAHDESLHAHAHAAPATSSTGLVLSIGLLHGLAGSAAFMILMLSTVDSPLQALGYLAFFSAGTIAGMGALTAILGLPLGRINRVGGWFSTATMATIGLAAITVGAMLATESLTSLLEFMA